MARRATRYDSFFRALIRLFPSEFRGDFGRQMIDDFHDQCQDAGARRGQSGVRRLWLRTAADVLSRAPLEHLDVLRRDASGAMRMLRKRPVSTATVVLSLAIGIGLNVALFTVVGGVLWRSLPYPAADRLVRIVDVETTSPDRTAYLTHAETAGVRDQARAFSAIGGGGYRNQTIVEPGEPEELPGMMVTEGFFEALGVTPVLGRTFTDTDFAASDAVDPNQVSATADRLERHARGEPLAASVVVISDALWQRRFLRRPDIIGQRLRLASGIVVEVVGVMGPEMSAVAPTFGVPPDWWYPRAANRDQRRGQILDVIARLAPGASLEQAQAELDVIAKRLAGAYPDTNAGRSFRVVPLLDSVVRNVRGQLGFLFAAVGCVLLVTCANVVHLFLAGAAGRRLELATRAALGATRAHLIRQTLTESALLAALGGVGGLLLAVSALPVLLSLAPAQIPRLEEIGLDWSTYAFAAALSVSVALLCGTGASLPLTTLRPWSALGRDRGGTLRGRRVRHALAASETAIALMLVVASMLMVRTMRAFASLDLGYDPTGVITASMPRPAIPATTPADLTRLHASEAQVIDAVRRLPSVVAAGVGSSPMGQRIGLGGVTVPGDDREFPMVGLEPVSVGYFEALGARLEAGRFFTPEDRAGAPPVLILSESAARRFWPAGNAVGKTLIVPASGPVQVVGVVADMAEWGLTTKGGGIFLPQLQSSYIAPGRMLIRATGDPLRLVPAIKSIVRRVNPEQPFPGVTLLQEEIEQATAPRRFILRLVGLFSILGLGLAVIGIYGVLAESVAERVPEIGVRMALGAAAAHVVALVLRQGALIIGAGLGSGLAAALLLRREMVGLVFGVGTLDPVSYAVACAVLVAVGLAACAIPARRAARLDPAVALRVE